MNSAEAKLVAALRSDHYIQGKHFLRNGNGAFCCLGVACDIYDPDLWSKTHYWDDEDTGDNGIASWVFFGADISLPEEVQENLGWSSPEGRLSFSSRSICGHYSLTLMNDEGFTFDQIADIIQAGLVEHKQSETDGN